jgi:hypothetical protein
MVIKDFVDTKAKYIILPAIGPLGQYVMEDIISEQVGGGKGDETLYSL